MSTRSTTAPRRRWYPVLPVFAFLLLVWTFPVRGEMRQLSDGELERVVGTGFSRFSFTDGVARADFAGVSGATYAEIDSLKLGFWGKGAGKGWDQNWSGVKLGSAKDDLVFNGFFFAAVFDPNTVSDPAGRTLLSLSLGSRDVTGTVSADFRSLTGVVGGVNLERSAVGARTYLLDHTELSFTLEVSGPRKGVWVNMGNAKQL